MNEPQPTTHTPIVDQFDQPIGVITGATIEPSPYGITSALVIRGTITRGPLAGVKFRNHIPLLIDGSDNPPPPSLQVTNPETPLPPRTMTTGRGPTHPRTQTPMGM